MTQSPIPPVPPTAGPEAAPTSKAAVTSLVLGIIGFCTAGLGGVVGIIVGIVAMNRIANAGGRLGGRGLAITGTAVSGASIVVGCLGGALLGGLLLPALAQARTAAQQMKSETQVRELCMAALIYEEEFGPLPVESWEDALVAENYVGPDLLVMSVTPGDGRAFAMNGSLAGVKLADVAEPWHTVVFFECAPGSPTHGGPELFPPDPRHPEGYIVGFADASAAVVPPEAVGDLRWQP